MELQDFLLFCKIIGLRYPNNVFLSGFTTKSMYSCLYVPYVAHMLTIPLSMQVLKDNESHVRIQNMSKDDYLRYHLYPIVIDFIIQMAFGGVCTLWPSLRICSNLLRVPSTLLQMLPEYPYCHTPSIHFLSVLLQCVRPSFPPLQYTR